MQLTGKYRIVIEGDAREALLSPQLNTTMEYLLRRLLMGLEVDESELFDRWGITVREEPAEP